MYRNRAWLEPVARCMLALCLSLALCLDMGVPKLSNSQSAGLLTELFYNTSKSLTTKGGLAAPLFLLLFWACWRIDERNIERRRWFPVVNGLIALVWLMGEGFRVDDTLWTLHASFGQLVKSFIYFVGITYGLNQMSCLLYSVLEKQELKKREGAPRKRRTGGFWRAWIAEAYQKHTVTVSFAAVFIFWLPHLILAYPPNIDVDAYSQLTQFFGLRGYSSHHPVPSTLLLGGLVKAGFLISHSYNFGLFFYIAVRAIIGAWILAYTLYLMRELNTPVWLRSLAYGCYSFAPCYTALVGAIGAKDLIYAYAVLLFTVELIYFLLKSEGFFRSKRHILLMAVSIAGTVLLRNNGKYALYPTIAVVLLYVFSRSRKSGTDKKGRGQIFFHAMAIFLIPVLLAEVFSAAMMSYLDVTPGSIREALSLPMQQTARYVKEFGDEVTEDEKAAISAVLNYEKLAKKYDPRTSDPVKATFKSDPTMKELSDYLLVWLKQFTKHPFVYFKATANQNYYLLYPFVPKRSINVDNMSNSEEGTNKQKIVELLKLSDVEIIASLKNPLKAFYNVCYDFPVLNMLSHPAFYMTMLIWLTLFSLYKKRFLWLLASVPAWLSAVIIVLAPVVQARYALPIIYAMPSMLAYYIYLENPDTIKKA